VGGSGIVTVDEGLPGLECEKKLGWNGRGAGENGNKCNSHLMFCEMKTFVLIANLSNCGYKRQDCMNRNDDSYQCFMNRRSLFCVPRTDVDSDKPFV